MSKEKIFDVILADALRESMDREFKEIDEMPEVEEIPAKSEKKMRKLKKSVGRKDRAKKCRRVILRIAVSAAAALGVVFGGLLTQGEVFAAVQNVFRGVFDKYDKYEFAGGDLTVDNFDDSFRLGYVPDGYYLSLGNYSPVRVTLFYTNENEEIKFMYSIADSTSISLDNEHNTYYEFEQGGRFYHYYESNDKDFYSTLLWYEDGYDFTVMAHLPKDELVKIAENLEK